MGRKKKVRFDNPAGDSIPQAAPAPEPKPNGSERIVLTFPLDEDSTIKLRELLKNPDVLKNVGPIASEVIRSEWCGKLYDGLGKVLALVAVKVKGVPPEIASEAFLFSEAEKNTLAEPTARVVNKYATEWMIRFQDEIGLAFLIVSIISAKTQFCNAMIAASAQAAKDREAASKPN
jgi:hypothetical protein